MARIVLTSFGSFGDVNPYIGLGLTLKARRHTAVLAMPPIYREIVEAQGLEFRGVRPDLPVNDHDLTRRIMDPNQGTEVLFRELLLPGLEQNYAELAAAEPDAWVELSAEDAAELGIEEGALVRVSSPRGSVEVKARVRPVRKGTVFVPFHYGYWDVSDDAGPDGRPRAANELTMTIWDPVSKQPLLKSAAVRIERVE